MEFNEVISPAMKGAHPMKVKVSEKYIISIFSVEE
jgi:hypothetical protein